MRDPDVTAAIEGETFSNWHYALGRYNANFPKTMKHIIQTTSATITILITFGFIFLSTTSMPDSLLTMTPSYYSLLASSLMLLLCTASMQAQDICFSLTKHSDTMILHPLGPFEVRDDRLSDDHLSTSAAWKYTGFKYQESDKGGAFTLVKSGDGSEVRLKVRK